MSSQNLSSDSLSDSDALNLAGSPTLVHGSDHSSPEDRNFQQELEEWISSNDAQHCSLQAFWAALHLDSSGFAHEALDASLFSKSGFLNAINKLCRDIHEECGLPSEALILFRSTNQLPMKGSPNGSRSQPDIVASTAAALDASGIHWSGVDAVVEVASERRRGRDEHAISHVVQLLEARPDLVCAFGFHVDTDGILLILGSPSGILLSPKLSPSDEEHIRLLAAFVKRIYIPHPLMIDPTIHRRLDVSGQTWVFDISLAVPTESDIILCTGYSILSSHRSIGERSHIFQNTHSPAMVNGVPMPIVKDHYRHPDNTHSEAEVLRHIQAEGMFPGVVEMVYSTDKVLREDKSLVSSGVLVKARIGLRQFGTSFMDLKTPREALMAIYDLLEVTRVLYQSRGVMHRDISDGNVLLVSDSCESAPTTVQQQSSGTSYPVCFSRYLLNKSDDPSRTNVLLIDFDQSVIISNHESTIPKQRLATRRFVARAVDGRRAIDIYNTLWLAPPEMESDVRKRYANVHAERLKRFAYSSPYHFVFPPQNADPESGHRLWHEAESAFWLLFWWAIRAQPSTSSSSYVPPMVWNIFQSNDSCSRRICTVDPGALDPVYEPLEVLLRRMGGVINPDLRWASAKPYNESDFLHDTLQRHILNFLVLNDEASFMDVLKAPTRRVCEPQGYAGAQGKYDLYI